MAAPHDPSQTLLLEILSNGEIELTTLDPEVARRAAELHVNTLSGTFAYFNGTKTVQVTGLVKSVRNETPFRFSVMPEKPPQR